MYNFSVKKQRNYEYRQNRQIVGKEKGSGLKTLVQHCAAMGHPGKPVSSVWLIYEMIQSCMRISCSPPKDQKTLHDFSLSSSLAALNLRVRAFRRNEKKLLKENRKRFTPRMYLRYIHVTHFRSPKWPVSKQMRSKTSSLCSSYQE